MSIDTVWKWNDKTSDECENHWVRGLWTHTYVNDYATMLKPHQLKKWQIRHETIKS